MFFRLLQDGVHGIMVFQNSEIEIVSHYKYIGMVFSSQFK